MKKIVKKGRKIIGFVYENQEGFWYAFGKPSQASWIAFACESIDQGVASIEKQNNAWEEGLIGL